MLRSSELPADTGHGGKSKGTVLEVPIIRIISILGLNWGPLFRETTT